MAESRFFAHPWDQDHSEEGLQAVGENETLHDALMDNASQLFKKMKLSDTFWGLLVQRGVVDDGVKSKIQMGKTPQAQAMALVQHLLSLEVYKLHGFVWALVNSNQGNMAELLGFSTDDYLDMEVFMMSSSFRCPACSEFYTKAYILTGCGHYICAPCAKGAKFLCKDNKKEDVTCPVPDCRKTTETSPSEGSLGLEEDVAFNDLCDVFVKKFSQKRECDKTNSENAELKYMNVYKVKAQRAKLKQKVAKLERFRDTLGEQEATLKDHIKGEQEKIKQSVDDWAQKNLKAYAGLEHQVDKNLHKSLQWEKVASELSVFLRTQPWFSEIGQTMEDVLTKEADSPIPIDTLMKDLDSGISIVEIHKPYKLDEPVEEVEIWRKREMKKSFLFSGLTKEERVEYGALIEQLGGQLLDTLYYDPTSTHLIIEEPVRNEKFLSCVAAGKWVLHKSYLDACRKANAFVKETDHEWGSPATAYKLGRKKLAQAAYRWHRQLTEGRGAFSGWKCLILTDDKIEGGFRRILEAGGAVVLTETPAAPFLEGNANYAFIDLAKYKGNVDLNQLVSAGFRCVKHEFITAYLTELPLPDPETYYISELEAMASGCRIPLKLKPTDVCEMSESKRPRLQ